MTLSFWRRARSVTVAIAAACSAVVLSSCGVPLGPGYQVQKETLTVHFIPSHPPHLAIQAEYRLANTGNAPLHFFDAALPSAHAFGSANLHAVVDGREVALQAESAADSTCRIQLPSEWRKKAKVSLRISYDLAASPPADARILVATKTFYLNDSGWFPKLLPFKAFLAPQVSRPSVTDLSVIVPADFRATASGRPYGTKKRAGELEYRFRIGKADFDPFVIAGQYSEQRVSLPTATVIFWSWTPLPEAQAQQTAAQIGRAVDFFMRAFSRLPKSVHTIHDVDFSAPASPPVDASRLSLPPATVSGGFGRSRGALPPSAQNSRTDSLAAQLANTWFSHVVRPRSDAWTLGPALALYAAAQLDQANGASRRHRILSTLSYYDRLRTQAVEKPPLSIMQRDPQSERQIAAAKLQLFFAALEDKCGQQNVTHAIAHMVYALQGGEYGYPEFRSALEQRCHQDLAGLFRVWLAQPGIPPDFRARYEGATGNKQSNPQ